MKKAPIYKPHSLGHARAHKANPKELTGWGQGRTSRHRASRERILARDHYLCQCPECRALGRIRPATIVDHVDNRRGAGYEDDSNKMAMCATCHNAKSQLEAQIARGLARRPDWMDRTKKGGIND